MAGGRGTLVVLLLLLVAAVNAHYMAAVNTSDISIMYLHNGDSASEFSNAANSGKDASNGLDGVQSLAVHPGTGQVYAILTETGVSTLARISVATGAATVIKSPLTSAIGSLTIDCDGNAWASDATLAGATKTHTIYGVDLATGDLTTYSTTGVSTGGFCLANVPDYHGVTLYGFGATSGNSQITMYRATLDANNATTAWTSAGTVSPMSSGPVLACAGSNDNRDAFWVAHGTYIHEAFPLGASPPSRDASISSSHDLVTATRQAISYVDQNPGCTVPVPCPNDCSGHGTCFSNTGTCVCTTPWSGSACDQDTSNQVNSPDTDPVIVSVIAISSAIVVGALVYVIVVSRKPAGAKSLV